MAESSERRRRLAEAAIALVADRGMRALTHRAVDDAAGLPPGTASYHFSGRRDLVRAMLEEIAAVSRRRLELGPPRPAAPTSSPSTRAEQLAVVDQIVAVCADFIQGQLTAYRSHTLARYACEVEVAAHPELVQILHAADEFHLLAADACRALAVADPEAAGHHLLAFVDGIVHDRLLGVGSLSPGSPAEHSQAAAAAIRAYLVGLLSDTRPSAGRGHVRRQHPDA